MEKIFDKAIEATLNLPEIQYRSMKLLEDADEIEETIMKEDFDEALANDTEDPAVAIAKQVVYTYVLPYYNDPSMIDADEDFINEIKIMTKIFEKELNKLRVELPFEKEVSTPRIHITREYWEEIPKERKRIPVPPKYKFRFKFRKRKFKYFVNVPENYFFK